MEPSRDQIEIFVEGLFRHASPQGYVSLRAFHEDGSNKTFRITPTGLEGGLKFLMDAVEDDARRAANHPKPIVFCPPIAVFTNREHARECDLAEGLALSVECDQQPEQAKAKLDQILGPATFVVASGGKWTDAATGEIQDKLHLHWRLCVPARGADLAKLKQARNLATGLVGGDPSNKPVCHPIRWPGSWHRKAAPVLCQIKEQNPDQEIDLANALAALTTAAPPKGNSGKSNASSSASPPDWSEQMQRVISGEGYHAALASLAMKLLLSGMDGSAANNPLRALMEATTGPRDNRWLARYNDIPRAISTARAKIECNMKPDNGLPDLVIDDRDPTAVAKALAKLIAARDDFLFNGNAPVRVAVEADGMPRAIEVTTEAVRVLAHEICNPIKKLKQGDTLVALKTDIANIYLHGLEGRWGLKPFRGITTAPILGDDGSIRSASGYDAASGLWCHNIPALGIPERPSKQQAKAALDRLRFAFRTFPFADSESLTDPVLGVPVVDLSKPAGLDESTFLAALLTGVCRQSLELAPGFLCDAPSYSGAGCGKGKLVKAICIIASGAPPSAFTSGHDAGEFDKRLTSALVEAHPAAFLDNFNAKELRSDILASALTENPAMVRVMGHTKMVPLHVRTFIGITGNGIKIAEDMARRIIKSHLDAKMENPEERKFPPGFLDNILAGRNSLLSDALTIWRWGRQNPGALSAGRSLGSFEVWCQWVRDPLLALETKDPIDRLAEIKANDPRRRTLIGIFEVWWEKHHDNLLKASDLAPEVITLIDEKAVRNDDGSLRFSRQRVASFLSTHTGSHVGGYSLSSLGIGPPSAPVAHYKLTNAKTAPRVPTQQETDQC